jgi:hypothetical protein
MVGMVSVPNADPSTSFLCSDTIVEVSCWSCRDDTLFSVRHLKKDFQARAAVCSIDVVMVGFIAVCIVSTTRS